MSNDLVTLEMDLVPPRQITPAALFAPGGADPLISEIENLVRGFDYDLSSAARRKEIASLSAKVSKAKVFLDNMGKDLKGQLEEQVRPILDAVDACDSERKKIRDRLDALRDEARRPLTQWEEDQAARKDALDKRLYDLEQLAVFPPGQPAVADVQKRLDKARAEPLDGSWEEYAAAASEAKQNTISRLETILQQAAAYEEQQAELQRLREVEAKRQEEGRAAEMRAEAERKAREEADLKIQQERDARIRAEAEAERSAEREREKIRQEEMQKERDAKAREADRDHRARINREALEKMMEAAPEVTKEQAIAILTAIANGKVPHVRVSY